MDFLAVAIENYKKHSESYLQAESEGNEEKMDFLELSIIDIYTNFGFSDNIVDSEDFEKEARQLERIAVIDLALHLDAMMSEFTERFN